MIIFLAFNVIYGLGNLYLFFKVSNIFNLGMHEDIFLGFFIFLMASSPIFIHQYSLKGSEKKSRIFAFSGYMWMAFIVVFSPFAVLLDAYNFIVQHAVFLFGKNFNSIIISQPTTFFIPFFISAAFNIYGFFEAKRLKVEKLTINTSKLPSGIDRITIAQIADLHLGIITGDKTLNKVIKEIGKELDRLERE